MSDTLKFFISDDERLDYVNEKIMLIQKKNGLTFGTDAFLLAAYAKSAPSKTAAELGCGTGIVSLLCAAREKFSKIYAFEVQEGFYDVALRNTLNNGFEGIVIPRLADIRDVKATDVGGEIDAVFANPPYMKTDSGKRNNADEKYIARHEVMGAISDFCACASRLLKYGGKFYVVWRPDRLSELFSAMSLYSLEPKTMTFVHANENREPSMVLICAVKGGKPSLKVTPPLFLNQSLPDGTPSSKLTEKAEKIYDTMNFDI